MVVWVEYVDDLGEWGFFVFDVMGFVDDDVFLGEFLKMGFFLENYFVVGDVYVEIFVY